MAADPQVYHSPYINTLRSTAWWLYLFHAVCFILTLGIFSFIPLILDYLARPKAVNTYVYTHYTWQIRSASGGISSGSPSAGFSISPSSVWFLPP